MKYTIYTDGVADNFLLPHYGGWAWQSIDEDGVVTHGDALKMDTENFEFYKLDKVRNLTTGAILTTYWQYTTANVEKVAERRGKWWLWIAEHGWVKYFKPMPYEVKDVKLTETGEKIFQEAVKNDPLPTEIKKDKNGQYTLF